MTDSPDLPGLPPDQEAVRRLLADARHDGPTPPQVVDRLDATLAALAAERDSAPTAAASPRTTSTSHSPSTTPAPSTTPTSSTRAPVVDLAARRRRTAGIGLLAAAAVVVAGVAIGNGLPSMSGGSDDSGAASSADGGTSRELGDSSAGGGAAEDGTSQQPRTQLGPGLTDQPQLSTSDSDLDDDLLLLRDTPKGSSAASEPAREKVCAVPGVGRGRQVGADVDGVPGLVVFRRADGGTQRVDLYVCGDPSAVRTLTLPAP